MASDEDEELAALRASRKDRLGAAGLTRTEQRRQIDDAVRHHAPIVPSDDDDEDDNQDEELPDAEVLDDDALDLRHHFPLEFGGAPRSKRGPPPNMLEAFEAHARKTFPTAKNTTTLAIAGNTRGGVNAHGGAGEGDGEEEEAMVGPVPPRRGDAENGGEEEGEEEEDNPYLLPLSHELQLKGFDRMVSALDMEHSGGRLLAGGHDYKVCIYDFNGMKSDARPFRELEPNEGHPVHAVSWSPTGDAFLVVTGAAQPKLYDRDGQELGEFVRGDMYLRDMKNTKGHVSGCSGGQWHPVEKTTAMTCGEDGTVRVWDTDKVEQKTVIKPTPTKPGRVQVTTACYSPDGGLIAAALMDGTLQLWDVRGDYGRSAAVGHVLPPKAQLHLQNTWKYMNSSKWLLRRAHESDMEVSGLAVGADRTSVVSRGTDGTVKLWDLRSFKQPVHVFGNLPTHIVTTNVIFSPDSQLIVTGTAADREGNGGGIVFLDKSKLTMVRRVGMPQSVAALHWQPRINQIVAGVGNRKEGWPTVLYDPAVSERGALLSVSRVARQKDPFDFEDQGIHKRKRGEEERVKAASKKAPDPGKQAQGPGRAGKIGTTGGTLLTQHLLKKHGMLHNPDEEQDVRAAILRHGNDQMFSAHTAAYAQTQPERILAQPDEDEDQEEGG